MVCMKRSTRPTPMRMLLASAARLALMLALTTTAANGAQTAIDAAFDGAASGGIGLGAIGDRPASAADAAARAF